jgi:7-cyano-7-deazaguanine synthase in queuosine biosynthesis
MKKVSVIVGENTDGKDIHLLPSQNLYTGISRFISEFGEANSLEEDLFNVASGVYATDLAVKREEREHYIRTIELFIEVVNFQLFERVKKEIENALHVVSKDNWNITFIQKEGNPLTSFEWEEKDGAVLLFSGGIDSMCAASEFIKDKKDLVLVSHNSLSNHAVEESQNKIHEILEKHYETSVKHIHIRVFGRNHNGFSFPKDELRENTQRTRSFLFLTLAALVTRRSNFNKILYMAENGQFAIHLPLNSARVGPFSTHTADPEFVSLVQNLFKTLLNNPKFEIYNPFLYMTKAEVFALLPEELKKQSHFSASCWMISRLKKHCGYCIPCISRRISLEFNGISFKEYEVDIFKTDVTKLDEMDDKRRNLTDYLEFILKFNDISDVNRHFLKDEFPELYNNAFNFDKAVELYNRVSRQSFEVFKKYPKVSKII